MVSRGKKIAVGIFFCASAVAGYVGYKYIYLPWIKDEVMLELQEILHLPSSTSDSFQDLSAPTIDGTIRVKCNLLQRCKFLLKMNNVGVATISESKSAAGGTQKKLDSSSHLVEWFDVKTNQIVDPLEFEGTGKFLFIPACYGDYLLAEYRAKLRPDFLTSVSVRDCWLQLGTLPNSHRLSLELIVHRPAIDVCVRIVFPKNSTILSVGTGGIGAWHAADGSSSHSEFIWEAGSYGKNKELRPGGGAHLFLKNKSSSSNPGEPGHIVGDESMPASVMPLGQEDMHQVLSTPDIAHISLECIYIRQPDSSVEDRGSRPQSLSSTQRSSSTASPPNSSSHRHGKRKKGGKAHDDATTGDDQFAAFDEAHYSAEDVNPSVYLTYMTSQAASGLEVRSLRILEDNEVSNANGGQKKKKPIRQAWHRTMHSQIIPVVPTL